MNWTKVESSQIDRVGYEEGAEYSLGVQFTQTKKQLAANQPGSIYVYANVSPELFTSLVEAVSVGSFFGDQIKKHPELFPYKKIEPEV